jgi:uncharacterized protein YacL
MAETQSAVLSSAREGKAAGKALGRRRLRLLSSVLFGVLGGAVALVALPAFFTDYSPWWLAGSSVIGLLIGFFFATFLTLSPARWYADSLRKHAKNQNIAAFGGLLGGLLAGALLTPALSNLPGSWGVYLPITTSAVLGVIGASIGYFWAEGRTFAIGASYAAREGDGRGRNRAATTRILVDTSAVIDGRIADISETGFVTGPLLIPRFVLDELRHIADSSDGLRRNRGRRGLEILNRLRREAVVPVEVIDIDVKDVREVDAKLVKLAAELGCAIITTDFNLNRVAELQGIQVLNVNELANSLRPVMLPGEEMTVDVVQEGKEHNQGIAFLDDGTMVVIENGRPLIGRQQTVTVSRVLQTSAGRIIFAHIRDM